MNGVNVKGLAVLEVFFGCTGGGIHIILRGISWILAQVGDSSWISLRELMKSILILFIFERIDGRNRWSSCLSDLL